MNDERIISASIVLYNTSLDQLELVINSFNPSKLRILFVVDNSPKKNKKIELLMNKFKFTNYIFTNKNNGYGAGHNIAIKKAIEVNTQYHVVLNPDLKFDSMIIDKIADFMDSNNDIAQVMPKILDGNGNIQYLCKLIPSPIDLILKRFLPKSIFKKNAFRYQLKFADYQRKMNVPYLSGCFMFFRTSAFNKVGLFDERFFMYPEDIDITRRMHKIYMTVYYPDVTVIHNHSAESYKTIKMLIVHTFNIIKYFNKWGWFFDKERKEINMRILDELNYNKR